MELIGKHVDVGAFRENVHVAGEMSLIERLQAGRNRIRRANIEDAEYVEVPKPVTT